MSDTEIHVEPEGVMHDNHVPPEGVRLVCEEKMEEPKVAELPQTDAPKKAPRKKPAAKRTTPYNNPVKEAIDRNMSLPLAGKGKGKGKGKNLTVGKDSEVVERTEVVAGGSAGSAGVGGTQYSYNNLEELLDSLDPAMTHFCPIHKDMLMEELHSKKEHVKDTFLRCNVKGCPCFCDTKKHEEYYRSVTSQGHEWFTLERIAQIKCACGYDPTLLASKSKKNPGRMYLRCRDFICKDFFAWWDMKPPRPVQVIMLKSYC